MAVDVAIELDETIPYQAEDGQGCHALTQGAHVKLGRGLDGSAEFGVRKPVVANLLMAALIIGGLVASTTLRKQFFPETDPDTATIAMPYPGAAPEEVESSLAIKVEDALRGIDEVDEIRTTVAESGGGITVKFKEGVDVDKAMEDVEREIDALQDLPTEAEEITTQLIEPRLPVIRVVLAGIDDPYAMKQAIRTVRDDLRSLPDMGEILIGGTRAYEISLDVESPPAGVGRCASGDGRARSRLATARHSSAVGRRL